MNKTVRSHRRGFLALILAMIAIVIGVRGEGQNPAALNNRIAANPNLAVRTRLTGHLPGWVKPTNEAGEVPDSRVMELTIVLCRAPLEQARFNQLLADQQNPRSPRYHRWLTPLQIGDRYGPTKEDLNVLTQWVEGQGFQVQEVAPSRMFVRVSATAGIVGDALSTSFRMYRIPGAADGKSYVSATTEPSVPSPLVPLVASIAGLTDIPEAHLPAAQATRTLSLDKPAHPETTLTNGEHIISPGDFAVIYNIAPVYQEGFDGTGQRVAIMGLSKVNPSDITNFEARVDQPSELPNPLVPPVGHDPMLGGDPYQEEATLDVERVVGTAPGAKIDLVVTCSQSPSNNCPTSAIDGIFITASYNVQTLLDPIMTMSFNFCEAEASPAYVTQYDALFSQAAAEGISVFASSGDSAAAGCENKDAAPNTSMLFRTTNLLCSSGAVTCVGGTEFSETSSGGNASMYWGAKNGSNQSSAIMYIPEGAWNEPTDKSPPFVVFGTGGGVSAYVQKPPFQAGAGVPPDGYRDTPDVSFSAATHDGYFGCYADPSNSPSTPNPCVPDPISGQFTPTQFYGTSAATPSMAAITALLNQKLGSFQGNLNPLLYSLAANPGNGVFHDVTVQSSGVSDCTLSVPSMCNNSVPSATALTGGLAGYAVSAGYDQATGWGSIDVANLLSAATSVMSFTINPMSSSLSIGAGSMVGSQDVLTLSSVGGFGGMISLTCTIKSNGPASPTKPPTCSFLDPYVTLVSGGTGVATLTLGMASSELSRGSESAALQKNSALRLSGVPLLTILLVGFANALRELRRYKCGRVCLMLILGMWLSCLLGCGPSGLTPGSYTILVTGTASTSGTAMNASTTVGLTVQ